MVGNTSVRLHRGFTLIELLVVVSIIGVLIAILIPSLQRARQTALDVACLSNLRQLGHAFAEYTTEGGSPWLPHPVGNPNTLVLPGSNGSSHLPKSEWSKDFLYPLIYPDHLKYDTATGKYDLPADAISQLGTTTPDPNGGPDPYTYDVKYGWIDRTVFQCPAAKSKVDLNANGFIDSGYGMSAKLNLVPGSGVSNNRLNFKRLDLVARAAETCLLIDDNMPWAGNDGADGVTILSPPATPGEAAWNDERVPLQNAAFRHNNKLNVLYVDFHADSITYAALPKPRPGTNGSNDVQNSTVPNYSIFWYGN